jgi:putative transcriptional regulator
MFEYDKNIPEPGRGDLLISEPFLNDPNFERTVVLICEHNDQGTFGLVLNKKTDLLLDDVLTDPVDYSGVLNLGGPVEQNTLHFVHRKQQALEGSIELGDGLAWGGNFEQIKLLLSTGQLQEADIQFYLGYSGWAEGQLREELDANSWFVKKGSTQQEVFEMSAEELWKSVLKTMGGKYKVFSNYPVDPRLN